MSFLLWGADSLFRLLRTDKLLPQERSMVEMREEELELLFCSCVSGFEQRGMFTRLFFIRCFHLVRELIGEGERAIAAHHSCVVAKKGDGKELFMELKKATEKVFPTVRVVCIDLYQSSGTLSLTEIIGARCGVDVGPKTEPEEVVEALKGKGEKVLLLIGGWERIYTISFTRAFSLLFQKQLAYITGIPASASPFHVVVTGNSPELFQLCYPNTYREGVGGRLGVKYPNFTGEIDFDNMRIHLAECN